MDAPEAFAEALWDHVTMDPEELSFSAGDIITIISWTDTDWWWGQVGDRIGWFPAPFVRVSGHHALENRKDCISIVVTSALSVRTVFLLSLGNAFYPDLIFL